MKSENKKPENKKPENKKQNVTPINTTIVKKSGKKNPRASTPRPSQKNQNETQTVKEKSLFSYGRTFLANRFPTSILLSKNNNLQENNV